MTVTFERFLRSFDDDELRAFAHARGRVRPPYWKVMRLALQIEATRRGLRLEQVVPETVSVDSGEPGTRMETASPTERAPGW